MSNLWFVGSSNSVEISRRENECMKFPTETFECFRKIRLNPLCLFTQTYNKF